MPITNSEAILPDHAPILWRADETALQVRNGIDDLPKTYSMGFTGERCGEWSLRENGAVLRSHRGSQRQIFLSAFYIYL
jgi:hypothetical protein